MTNSVEDSLFNSSQRYSQPHSKAYLATGGVIFFGYILVKLINWGMEILYDNYQIDFKGLLSYCCFFCKRKIKVSANQSEVVPIETIS